MRCYRELVYKSLLKVGYKGVLDGSTNRYSVEKDILRIDITNEKQEKDGFFSVVLVYKEQMQNGNYEEIDRETVTFNTKTIQYNISEYDKYVVDKFCLKQNRKSEDNVYKNLEKIAKRYFGVETLKTRNSDSLDFYDVSVWNMELALKAAFELGLNYKE